MMRSEMAQYNSNKIMKAVLRYIKLLGLFFCVLGLPFCKRGNSQAPDINVADAAFDKKLKSLLRFSTPIITVDSLFADQHKYTILDAREKKEYDVSHIPQAISIGYNAFDINAIKSIAKDEPIVVYCSVGYRSEKIAEKLMKAGYTNVVNLYGSIFEWVNQGYPVVDTNGQPADAIHTYNRRWSQWVNDDIPMKKVY